jgi:Helix-turn-helix domain
MVMSAAMMNALMTPGLTPNESRVYAYIVGRANGARVCWPTVEDIAADLKMSRRAVIDATTELHGHPANPEKKIPFRPKLIDVKRRYRQSNNYVVIDVPGLYDKPLYAGRDKSAPAFAWSDGADPDPGVQIPAHVSPDPGVQIPAHVPETPPLECKIPHSGVQISAPESVLQESIKEEKEESSLRSERAPASNVVMLSVANEAQQVVEAWNAVAERCDLPRLRSNETARRKASTLIRRNGIEDVMRAIQAVEASPHCTGANGWRADFYFLQQTKSFERLLSGFYSDRPGRGRAKPGTLAAFAQSHGIGAMQPTFDPEPDDNTRRVGQ